jgi:hypothetical protein
MRDLRDLAVAYAIAIIVTLALVAVAIVDPGLVAESPKVAELLSIPMMIGVYIACGALLVSLMVHRVAAWPFANAVLVGPARWRTILAWPVIFGGMLWRLALPHEG